MTFKAPIRYLEAWSGIKSSNSDVGMVGVLVDVDGAVDFGLLVDISRGVLFVWCNGRQNLARKKFDFRFTKS